MLDDKSTPNEIIPILMNEISDGLGRKNLNDAISFLEDRKNVTPDNWKSALSNTNVVTVEIANKLQKVTSDESWKEINISVTQKLAFTENFDEALKFIENTEPDHRYDMSKGLISPLMDYSKNLPSDLAKAKKVLTEYEIKMLANSMLAIAQSNRANEKTISLLKKIINQD